MFQQVTKVVTYYFSVIILLPYYFFTQKSCCTGVFLLVFTSIYGKIEKNLPIFCNFFSLCINDLQEI